MLIQGNGYHDSTGLDETCFHGTLPSVDVWIQKANTQIKELLYWLSWITDWAEESIERSKAEEMRDKCMSHLHLSPYLTSSTIAYSALCRTSPIYRQYILTPLNTCFTFNIISLWFWTIITTWSGDFDSQHGWIADYGRVY